MAAPIRSIARSPSHPARSIRSGVRTSPTPILRKRSGRFRNGPIRSGSSRSIRGDISSRKNFASEIAEGIDIRPSIAITRARLDLPELQAAIAAGRLKHDGEVVHKNGSVSVVKIAIDPVWYLPGLAERFATTENNLRRQLFEQTAGMFPELVTRPDLQVFLPPIGGTTAYLFGDVTKLPDHRTKITCRVHDECNGSDVFGSDICTCRPYLIHGIEECARAGQTGGLGIIIYNRKEGRALGEVTKFLVYNARKRQEGGDAAAQYFERTECVAGVQDARFQQLMPDVVHWLGLKRIDRFVSMSDMKHDALTSQGIEIVERVPIPDDLVPGRRACGNRGQEGRRLLHARAAARPGQSGRPFAREILRGGRVPRKSGDVGRFVIAECQRGSRARASHAGDRPRRQASEFPHPPRSHGRHRRSGAGDDAQGLSLARRFPFIRAGGTSSRMGTIAGPRSPTGPHGPIARPAPAPNSIWPSSASSSMPAPARRGATAIPRPDRRSAVRKDWDWPASRCSRAAHSRPIRCSRCGPMPACSRISASPTSSAACRSRTPIRWSGSTAAPTCCAASAGWWPSKPDVFGSHDTPRPGGLFDRLAMLADDRQASRADDPVGTAATARADLAVAADARRDRARRLLEASGADDGGCDQRPGAAAQAVAMAGLFADRTAADAPASM